MPCSNMFKTTTFHEFLWSYPPAEFLIISHQVSHGVSIESVFLALPWRSVFQEMLHLVVPGWARPRQMIGKEATELKLYGTTGEPCLFKQLRMHRSPYRSVRVFGPGVAERSNNMHVWFLGHMGVGRRPTVFLVAAEPAERPDPEHAEACLTA